MALHTDLPIYRAGAQLLGLAVSVQEQMPRSMKRFLGEKIVVHCVDMLDLMALANASQHEVRAGYIEQRLASLHLRINPAKTILQPVDRGVDLVGHVIKPWHRATRRRTVATAIERMATVPEPDLRQVANSYFGLLRQATHSHADRAHLANAVRDRGHCVDRGFTKAY